MTTLKSRKELMVVDERHGGYLAERCALCGNPGWLDRIKHKKDCPLRDPGITHVRMTACRAKVVLRRTDGKFWWRGYDIERRGSGRYTYYVMHDRNTGKNIMNAARLRDIRKYIADNQGVL